MAGYDGCRWARARLPLLAGDDLLGPERRRAERHLVGCPDCRRHHDALRIAVDALHEAAGVDLPAAEAPALWPDLARQLRESRRPVPTATGRPRLLAWSAAALAASVLLIVGVAGMLSRHEEPRRASSVATRPPAHPPVIRTVYPAQDAAAVGPTSVADPRVPPRRRDRATDDAGSNRGPINGELTH